MKTTLLHACALLTLAASASAEIIGVDTFEYANAAIAGQLGGTFWDYKNVAPAGHIVTASNWDNVSAAPVVASGRLLTSNSSAKREYNGASETQGAVNDANVNKVVYYRATVTTGATLPEFFGLSSYDFGTERIFFGKRFGLPNFGLEIAGGGSSSNSTIPVQPNTTYTLVARVDFNNTASGNTLRLYVNPDLNAAEPATADASTPFPNIEPSTAVRLASGFNGDPITWDNLVVATTWDDLGTVVTTTADENTSLVPGAGTGVSLREAVNFSPSGTLITFADALNGQTLTLTAGELTRAAPLTIDASSLPRGLTIDGNRASRIFYVGSNPIVDPSPSVLTLKSLTLVRGNGVGGVIPGPAGGAIFVSKGQLTLADCTLADNTADAGTAIFTNTNLTSRTTLLTRCTVSGNSSTTSAAAAIRNLEGRTVLRQCTISANTGGGVFSFGDALTETFVEKSIVAGNASGDVVFAGGAVNSFASLGSNLVGTGTGTSDFTAAGDQTGVTNPKLSPLAHFGGPTLTMHPLIGSPAIDAGGATDPGGSDQRGFPRFVDGDGSNTAQLDIGAVETWPRARSLFNPDHPVTTATDEDDGSILATFGAGTSLREVVKYAANGSVITFNSSLAAQTITLGGTEIPLNKNLFIDASNLTGPVTVSGNNASRVFNIASGASVAMQNLVITGGRTPDGASGTPGGDGGGILNGGSLTLLSCAIAGNRTGNGGNGSNIDGGFGGFGGGISSTDRLSLNTCSVTGNQTGNGGDSGNVGTSGGGGSGGGIFSTGTLSLDTCSITGNQTGSVGAGSASSSGGGGGGVLASSRASIRGTVFSGNVASGDGGAIRGGPIFLTHCTLSGNSALEGGGIDSSNAELEHTTVSGNRATTLGGGVVYVAQGGSSFLLKNSIVAGNTAGTSGSDFQRLNSGFPNLTTSGANLIGVLFDVGPFSGPAPLTGNPKLMPLGAYGGSTQTMPPLAGSPAIDAGAATSIFTTDQRGFPRVVDGNNSGTAQADLGAVEAAFRFVTNANDSGAGSLRQTLADAAAAPGFDAIAFSSALNGGSLPLTTAPTNNSGLEVTNPDGVSIDASSLLGGLTLTKPAGNYRLIFVNGGRLSLHHLSLTNGSRTDGGGAISKFAGSLFLDRCSLFGNSASHGGAIFNSDFTGGDTTLSHCTLAGNTATGFSAGGGCFNDSGRLTLLHCTVSGNTALAGFGGGIASVGDSSTRTELENSILAGNSGGDAEIVFGATNSFASLGHNLIGTGDGTGAFTQPGDIAGVADPLLSPLAPRGGPTQTMPPLPGSPALDAASSTATADQRGFPRNRSGLGAPDIGAVERGPIYSVSNNNGEGPASLRAALESAALSPDARIQFFPPNLDGQTITHGSAELFIPATQNVEIDATMLPAGLTISGNGSRRVFRSDGILSLQRLAVRNGSTSDNGAGIASSGTLLAVDCTIAGNATTSVGGGLSLSGGVADFLRCTISGNTAVNSGGISQQGSPVRTTLQNCTVAGNQTVGSFGGGMTVTVGTLDLRHCTIAQNVANGLGGGFFMGASGSVRLERSIVAGNTDTGGNPADIFRASGTLTPVGENLIGSNQSVTGQFPPGPLVGTQASPRAPLLAPLGGYGGPTFTMALKPGSPARNAATGSTILADQRLFPLVGTPDLGAYETGTLANYNAFIWETLPATATIAQHATTADYDGDGASNGDEFIALTNAADPASRFLIVSAARNAANLDVTFTSVGNRHYGLEYTTDFTTWTPAASGVNGTGSPITVPIGPVSGFPRFFVRARVGP